MSDQSVNAERNWIGSHFSTAWRAMFEMPRRRGKHQRRKSDYGQASTFLSRARLAAPKHARIESGLSC